MSIVGDYKFHSMLSLEGDEKKYVTAEELINKKYDESLDPEYVKHEKASTLALTKIILRISADGTLKALQPVPDFVTKEELDAAVAAGEVLVEDGYIYDKVQKWEDRDGVIYYDTGIQGTVFDQPADPWSKLLDDEGYVNYMLMRFERC